MNKGNSLEKTKKEFGKCEIELTKQQQKAEKTDLSWVRPGAHVIHSRYGNGLITDFLNDNKYVRIRFSTTESIFVYPHAFENGIITKYVDESGIPDKQQILLAKVGGKVNHKTFGEGIVKMIEGSRITVKFGDIDKTFKYPDAFNTGFLKNIE